MPLIGRCVEATVYVGTVWSRADVCYRLPPVQAYSIVRDQIHLSMESEESPALLLMYVKMYWLYNTRGATSNAIHVSCPMYPSFAVLNHLTNEANHRSINCDCCKSNNPGPYNWWCSRIHGGAGVHVVRSYVRDWERLFWYSLHLNRNIQPFFPPHIVSRKKMISENNVERCGRYGETLRTTRLCLMDWTACLESGGSLSEWSCHIRHYSRSLW